MECSRKGRVLVVDDEREMADLCVESLMRYGCSARGVNSGEKAVELVAQGKFEAVLLDIRMPGLGGMEALKRIRAARPDVKVVMITGYGSIESSVEAMRHGACDYITKPFNLEELALRVRRCLEERGAEERIAALAGEVNALMLGTTRALVRAIEAKNLYTRNHSDRVSRYALEIASHYPFSHKGEKEAAQQTIVLSGLLHDIGKIALPDQILNGEEKLGEKEWRLIRQHPLVGARILWDIGPLKAALPGIVYHHCHFNNPRAHNCYPPGKTGYRIPVQARIISVADTFDALTSHRPYRKALSKYEAAKIIRQESGRQFDPEAVEAFFCAFEVCFSVWKIGKE